MPTAAVRDLIERHGLAPHPEGGWFRETHRSTVRLPADALPAGYPGPRAALTSILFLLAAGETSRRHRVRGEELWLHQGGDDIVLTLQDPADGDPHERRLGLGAGAAPQVAVPPGWWQSARVAPGPHDHALVGCVVAPGFEFEDLEMADAP